MKKHIFLVGRAGIGKSELIREILGDKAAYAGGMITEQSCDEDGCFIGYELLPAAACVVGRDKFDAQLYLDCRSFPPLKDNEVFRNYGAQLLTEAQYYSFAMADEIGSFEIIIPQFRAALEEFLNLDIPIIGALADTENVRFLKESFGLGSKVNLYTQNLRAQLEKHPDTSVIELTAYNRDSVQSSLKKWAEEFL